MNEMQLGAGLADDGRVIVPRIIREVVQPMLHVDPTRKRPPKFQTETLPVWVSYLRSHGRGFITTACQPVKS
jgi:hypothetical protein